MVSVKAVRMAGFQLGSEGRADRICYYTSRRKQGVKDKPGSVA